MAELINTFSWSFSAANDFDECRRKRYWAKYAMWNGWNASAPQLKRDAYRLTKIENRYSLKGHAVELAIMWALKQKQQGVDVSVEQAYEEIARPYLNKAWQDSKNEKWREHPKAYCCLHEHYYTKFHPGNSREWTQSTMTEVKTCIENFIQSVLPRLALVRPEQEQTIATPEKGGDPESFLFNDLKIYAIPDYVYTVDDQWHIHDWKSGKPSGKHLDQLAIYGLWAQTKHHIPLEKIHIYIEYLLFDKVVTHTLTEEDIHRVRSRIHESVGDMSEYLIEGDRKKNKPVLQEEWELASSRSLCQRCNFYELCESEFND
ncbi:MAG: hypothetical protein GKR87_12180 [Kiritimatiellae bacterium]|nr:hypothetical protein [Kiritimatiellia bacterium]